MSSRSRSYPSIKILGKSSQSITAAEAEYLIFTCQKSVLHCKAFLNQLSFQLNCSSGSCTVCWAQGTTNLSSHPPGEQMILCSIVQQMQSKQSTLTFRAPLSLSLILWIVLCYVEEQDTSWWITKQCGPPFLWQARKVPPFCNCACLADAEPSTIKNGQNHLTSLMSSFEWSLPGNTQGCVYFFLKPQSVHLMQVP